MQKIRDDFDLISSFETKNWNTNNHYHNFLLEKLPQNCERVLEIGCGIGAFSRLLAERVASVTAMDLSPRMLERARTLSTSHPNIDFQLADVLEADLPAENFDAIVSIATLHHLPLEQVLPKLKRALTPGGRLLVLDMTRINSVQDFFTASVAVPLRMMLNIFHNGLSRPTKAEREAWEQHAKTDHYLSLSEARKIYSQYFEKAAVNRCLFFRYSAMCEK